MKTESPSTLAKRSPLPPAAYTLSEVAGLLRISYTQAHERARTGTLPVHGFQVGRQWRFPKADVDRLLGMDDRAGDASREDAA